MSSISPTSDQDVAGADSVSVSYDTNGEQNLIVVDGDQASAIVAIEEDVDPDVALELVDTVEAEIAHGVSGLRSVRREIAERVDEGGRS